MTTLKETKHPDASGCNCYLWLFILSFTIYGAYLINSLVSFNIKETTNSTIHSEQSDHTYKRNNMLFTIHNVSININTTSLIAIQQIPIISVDSIAYQCDHYTSIRVFNRQRNIRYNLGCYHDRIQNKNMFINNLKSKQLLYLKTCEVMDFIQNYLPKITVKFILVTSSHCDTTVPSRLIMNETTDHLINLTSIEEHKYLLQLLDNSNLIHWYTANYDNLIFETKYIQNKYRKKISIIPLGISLGVRQSPTQMLNELNMIQKVQEFLENNIQHSIYNRKLKIWIDSSLNVGYWSASKSQRRYRYYLDNPTVFTSFYVWSTHRVGIWGNYRRDRYRAMVYYSLLNLSTNFQCNNTFCNTQGSDDLFYWSYKYLNHYDLYMNRSEYVFILSPLGNGLDCLRTWEAILFGHIVIVQSSPIDALFIKHKLPVVIVKNWKEINESMLNLWHQKYAKLTYFENEQTRYKMTTHYWLNYMRKRNAFMYDFK